MRYLTWIITIPIALVAISFAVSNREPVELTLWPLPFSMTAPVYLLVLGMLVAGFVIGGLIAWAGQHAYRRDARRNAERVRQLSAELDRHREREARAREEALRQAEAARLDAAARAGDEAARLERPAAVAAR